MRLRPGFTVNLLDSTLTAASIAVSSGSRPQRSAAHAPNCVVAREDWRGLYDDERDIVLGAGEQALSTTLSILDLGDELLRESHETLLPLLASASTVGGDPSRADEPQQVAEQQAYVSALRTFQSSVSRALYERYGIIPETTGAADLVVHQPDQLSTAFNPGINAFMGLHIDSHQRLPFGDRTGAMTLCSVNVGFAERYLNFVNLPVRSLLEVLAERGVPAPESASDLKDAFFAEFPDYPVLRLTIRPGQAYLCNTQNTIHDGATNHAQRPDVSFLTLHRLTDGVPRPVAAGMAHAEAVDAGSAAPAVALRAAT